MFVFVLFEKNTENEVCVRERHFHWWWARDREVARIPESGCRALLPCPMAHARRHSRAMSCVRATAARTAKPFPELFICSKKCLFREHSRPSSIRRWVRCALRSSSAARRRQYFRTSSSKFPHHAAQEAASQERIQTRNVPGWRGAGQAGLRRARPPARPTIIAREEEKTCVEPRSAGPRSSLHYFI